MIQSISTKNIFAMNLEDLIKIKESLLIMLDLALFKKKFLVLISI